MNRFSLVVHPVTGRISNFRIKEPIKLTDPDGLLSAPTNGLVGEPEAFNGLNPLLLNGIAAVLGRSFDPEGPLIESLIKNAYDADVLQHDGVHETIRDRRAVGQVSSPGDRPPASRDAVS